MNPEKLEALGLRVRKMNSNAVRQTSERRIIKSLHSLQCCRHFNERGVLPAAHCACRAFSLWMLSCPQSGGFRNNAGAWQGVGLCASSFPAAFPPEFSLTQVSVSSTHPVTGPLSAQTHSCSCVTHQSQEKLQQPPVCLSQRALE